MKNINNKILDNMRDGQWYKFNVSYWIGIP